MFFRRFNIQLSISNCFGSALGEFATFCRFNALNSNPSRTLDNRDYNNKACCLNGTGLSICIFCLLKSVVSVRPVMGVYFKAPQNR